MDTTLILHILAGCLAIGAGFVALYSAKGATLHRKAGMVFVCSILIMCIGGFAMAAARDVAPATNIPAALLTGYFVITALTTVRMPTAATRRVDGAALLVGLGVSLINLLFGFGAIANGGAFNGIPAFPFFLFGVIGVLGVAGDLHIFRYGELSGARRIARHLWRMSFALFITALSLFIGQADEFPAAIRATGLLPLPVVAVLVTMVYWLWRVRIRHSLRGIAGTAHLKT